MIKGKYPNQFECGEDKKQRPNLSDALSHMEVAMKFVALEAPHIHKRIIESWDLLRNKIIELKIDGNDMIVNQQDQIIGRLTREIENLKATKPPS